MVSRTPIISVQERKVRWIYGSVLASTDDTFAVNDLSEVNTILGFKTADGAAVSFSIAGNVVTVITVGLVDNGIAFIAWGATRE